MSGIQLCPLPTLGQNYLDARSRKITCPSCNRKVKLEFAEAFAQPIFQSPDGKFNRMYAVGWAIPWHKSGDSVCSSTGTRYATIAINHRLERSLHSGLGFNPEGFLGFDSEAFLPEDIDRSPSQHVFRILLKGQTSVDMFIAWMKGYVEKGDTAFIIKGGNTSGGQCPAMRVAGGVVRQCVRPYGHTDDCEFNVS